MTSSSQSEEMQSNAPNYSEDLIAYSNFKRQEVQAKILEYSNDYYGLINYLETPENDEAVNQFKYYILTYLRSNEDTRKLFSRYKHKKRVLFYLNALVIVVILIFSDAFSIKNMPWLYNAKEMLATFSYKYYNLFEAILIILSFTSFLLTLYGWGKTELPANDKDSNEQYKKELYMYNANYEDVKKFLKIKFCNKIMLKLALDLFIISVILIANFTRTLTSYNYGLNLFILASSTVTLSLLLSIISCLRAKKLTRMIDDIYESRYIG